MDYLEYRQKLFELTTNLSENRNRIVATINDYYATDLKDFLWLGASIIGAINKVLKVIEPIISGRKQTKTDFLKSCNSFQDLCDNLLKQVEEFELLKLKISRELDN